MLSATSLWFRKISIRACAEDVTCRERLGSSFSNAFQICAEYRLSQKKVIKTLALSILSPYKLRSFLNCSGGQHQPFAAIWSRGAELFSGYIADAERSSRRACFLQICHTPDDPSCLMEPFMFPSLSTTGWCVAILAALSVGLAKSGFAGFGMVPVLLMAEIMPARESTGAVLPLLICGDLLAVIFFRKHAQWGYILRTLPPALAGIAAGWWLMTLNCISDRVFRVLIGLIVLALAGMQIWLKWRPEGFERLPHSRQAAWCAGSLSGITTMLANAAGPIMTLYLLAAGLPKWQFVGTAAFFFLAVNLVKVPFSLGLGLINSQSCALDLLLFPAVALGVVLGRKMIALASQKLFENLVLIFAALAAGKLIWEAR